MIVRSFLLCNKYGQDVGFMRDDFFNKKNIMILMIMIGSNVNVSIIIYYLK
jgi:hypothetical protein